MGSWCSNQPKLLQTHCDHVFLFQKLSSCFSLLMSFCLSDVWRNKSLLFWWPSGTSALQWALAFGTEFLPCHALTQFCLQPTIHGLLFVARTRLCDTLFSFCSVFPVGTSEVPSTSQLIQPAHPRKIQPPPGCLWDQLRQNHQSPHSSPPWRIEGLCWGWGRKVGQQQR